MFHCTSHTPDNTTAFGPQIDCTDSGILALTLTFTFRYLNPLIWVMEKDGELLASLRRNVKSKFMLSRKSKLHLPT